MTTQALEAGYGTQAGIDALKHVAKKMGFRSVITAPGTVRDYSTVAMYTGMWSEGTMSQRPALYLIGRSYVDPEHRQAELEIAPLFVTNGVGNFEGIKDSEWVRNVVWPKRVGRVENMPQLIDLADEFCIQLQETNYAASIDSAYLDLLRKRDNIVNIRPMVKVKIDGAEFELPFEHKDKILTLLGECKAIDARKASTLNQECAVLARALAQNSDLAAERPISANADYVQGMELAIKQWLRLIPSTSAQNACWDQPIDNAVRNLPLREYASQAAWSIRQSAASHMAGMPRDADILLLQNVILNEMVKACSVTPGPTYVEEDECGDAEHGEHTDSPRC